MSLLSFAKKISGREQKKAAPAKKASAKKPKVAAVEPEKIATTIIHTGVIGLEPLITEDSVTQHGDRQTIAFRVRPDAHKGAIAAAVMHRFGVEPDSVRTLRVRGKRRRRGQTEGVSNIWKKAYVTLPPGKTIDVTA